MTNPQNPDIGGDAAIEPKPKQQMQPWERLRLLRLYADRSYSLQIAIAQAQQNLTDLHKQKLHIDHDLIEVMGCIHPAVGVSTGNETLIVNVASSGMGTLMPIVTINPLLKAEDLVERVSAAEGAHP